jgi:hypothetical protein
MHKGAPALERACCAGGRTPLAMNLLHPALVSVRRTVCARWHKLTCLQPNLMPASSVPVAGYSGDMGARHRATMQPPA